MISKKLAILEILASFEKTISRSEIVEFVLKYDLMNYFEFQQFLDELLDSTFIETTEIESIQSYTITDAGLNALKLFQDRIPLSFQEMLKECIHNKRAEALKKITSSGEFIKTKDEDYQVNLKISEGNRSILALNIFAKNAEEARTMTDNWNRDPATYLAEIINILTKS